MSPTRAHRSTWRRVAGAAAMAVVAAACTSGPPPPPVGQSYAQEVAAWRLGKDAYFRSDDSPLPPGQRAAFTGLSYYPVDPVWRVPARLTEQPGTPPLVIELQTSTNQRRRMRRVGSLGFALGDQAYTLTSFADENDRANRRLFVPFFDLTAAAGETYQGGRYLDLDRTPTGLYDLDFNRAYHPFCVFNPEYDCPVPPRENRLTIAVRAGERFAPSSP